MQISETVNEFAGFFAASALIPQDQETFETAQPDARAPSISDVEFCELDSDSPNSNSPEPEVVKKPSPILVCSDKSSNPKVSKAFVPACAESVGEHKTVEKDQSRFTDPVLEAKAAIDHIKKAINQKIEQQKLEIQSLENANNNDYCYRFGSRRNYFAFVFSRKKAKAIHSRDREIRELFQEKKELESVLKALDSIERS
eukprot:GHVP01042043.1.p1 GENE.GHVP01042043.1~~GHVP01042043.1.p1  ORF type:complete len:211 (+),score=39.79 GHVP01042043.1:37-633(+)